MESWKLSKPNTLLRFGKGELRTAFPVVLAWRDVELGREVSCLWPQKSGGAVWLSHTKNLCPTEAEKWVWGGLFIKQLGFKLWQTGSSETFLGFINQRCCASAAGAGYINVAHKSAGKVICHLCPKLSEDLQGCKSPPGQREVSALARCVNLGWDLWAWVSLVRCFHWQLTPVRWQSSAGSRDLSFQARVSDVWAQAGEVFYGVDKVTAPTL